MGLADYSKYLAEDTRVYNNDSDLRAFSIHDVVKAKTANASGYMHYMRTANYNGEEVIVKVANLGRIRERESWINGICYGTRPGYWDLYFGGNRCGNCREPMGLITIRFKNEETFNKVYYEIFNKKPTWPFVSPY